MVMGRILGSLASGHGTLAFIVLLGLELARRLPLDL